LTANQIDTTVADPAHTTVSDCLSEAVARLGDTQIDDPRREARHLLAHVLETSVESVFAHPERSVDSGQAQRFQALIARRCRHEPLSRILGKREFWSLSFELSPATLDPRPDSETLIEAALELRPDQARALRILDLGTGSGCLIGALLSEYPKAQGTAVDLSADAVETARANLARLGFGARATCRQGEWDGGLEGVFDLIISNPPYIVAGEIDELSPAVAEYDPRLALSGGVDGLDAYRALVAVLSRRLAPDGVAIIELGDGQYNDVAALFGAGGLTVLGGRDDLGARRRCIMVSAAE